MNESSSAMRLLELLANRPKSILYTQVEQTTLEQWDLILRQARYQKITPLLHRQLKQEAIWDLVPSHIQGQLNARTRYAGLMSLKIQAQLLRLLPRLNAAGIPVIGLKGIHLAEFVYPGHMLRPMRDIDLLVHKHDTEAVDRILRSLGYALSGDEDWHLDNHFHFVYWSEATNFSFEIHWDIQKPTSAFPVDLDEWWQTAEQKQIGKSQMWVLAPEEALIHACIHLVKHFGQDGFKPLCDIAMMVESEDFVIDWERFIRIIAEQRVINPVCLTLRLAKELLHVDLPETMMRQIDAPTLTPTIYDWFKRQVTAELPQAKGALVSSHFAKLWRTRNPIKKAALLLNSLQLAPDGDPTRTLAAAPNNEKLAQATFSNRLERYSQRAWELLRGNPELQTQVDVMDWLSS